MNPPTPLPCGHHKYVVPYYAVVYQQTYLANNEMIWHNHGLHDQVTMKPPCTSNLAP